MSNCQKCGAPAQPNIVTCGFCGSAVSQQAAANAIPCPQCRTLNAWGSQKCLRCQAWVVVCCIFCNNLSPYTSSVCLTCQEPFANAAARKAQYDANIARQNNMQTAHVVGGVAAPFLGAMAGAAIGSSWGHHHYDYWGPSWGSSYSIGGPPVHHYHHYDYGPSYETNSYGGSTYDESQNAGYSSYDSGSSGSSCNSTSSCSSGSSCSSSSSCSSGSSCGSSCGSSD